MSRCMKLLVVLVTAIVLGTTSISVLAEVPVSLTEPSIGGTHRAK